MRHSLPALLLISCLAVPAHADKADRDKPIEISADKGTLDQKKGTTVWEGNVDVKQGTLLIQADKVIVVRDTKGQQQLQASGGPVKFRQKIDGSNEFVEGSANSVQYDNGSDLAILTGNARIKRGMDSVSGSRIVYNTATENYEVNGSANGSTGRVTVILQPKSKP